MRKTLGTIIIIVAALCVHTASDSYCTKERPIKSKGRKP